MNSVYKKALPWTVLTRLGKSKVLKSSYFWIVFVPIAAKIFEKLPETFPISSGPPIVELVLELPFSWEMFYFASCCFGVASLIFTALCPPLVKNFSDLQDYKGLGLTDKQLINYLVNWVQNLSLIHI